MKFNKLLLPLLTGLALTSIPTLSNAGVAERYDASCATCHSSGAFNAPQKGDAPYWNKLKTEKGMPALVKSVKLGGKQMPAGGLCADCKTSQDYAELIDYMSK
ncbi:c-type cytochrome [Psychrobacter sp.]|uniref:c-type cytochrome n=1 Tax=Psychrobacter sp. TaxID=56811 RepID=UPI0025CCE6EF|nr:c-type cytochrome [Psychrobacter sp.]